MQLQIKSGDRGAWITQKHFRPQIARIVRVVLEEAPEMEGGNVTITSGMDAHDAGHHPSGDALDFRGNSIKSGGLEDRRALGAVWAARVQYRLGGDYDSLWEEGTEPSGDHLHVEHDPKWPAMPPSAGYFSRIALLRSIRSG